MKIKAIGLLTFLIIGMATLFGCGTQGQHSESFLRLHIRANSNSRADQEIKYYVKDHVVDFLTPIIINTSNFNQVKQTLQNNLRNIERFVNSILSQRGFNYTSRVLIANEFFPTRSYGNHVLPANFYDALIIELGAGLGNNWWCVVYPPLCFIGNGNAYSNNFRYRSRILDMINNFFR